MPCGHSVESWGFDPIRRLLLVLDASRRVCSVRAPIRYQGLEDLGWDLRKSGY
jgi:hypothetical protein